jgi:two-component system chemotaxis response regulator CheY
MTIMDIEDDAHSPHFKLPAVLDLAAADGFLEAVRARVLPGSPLRLDASGVETLTLPCIQILLATLRSKAIVSIERPSDAFVAAFDDLGIDWSDWRAPLPAEEGDMPQTEQVEMALDGQDEVPIQLSPAPAMEEETSVSKRILTIDDSKTIRDMLKLTLLDAGFEVQQAVDGQDGVDILAKEKFDVVITDINMPKMDGYEVIRHMRGNSDHKSTPILVLTTESETEKRNLARDAGATGWMVKPFDPEQLVATIYKVAP